MERNSTDFSRGRQEKIERSRIKQVEMNIFYVLCQIILRSVTSDFDLSCKEVWHEKDILGVFL